MKAIRPHKMPGWEGLIDDVAIDCTMFRIEQMDDDAFWAAAYVEDKEVMFWIRWNRKKKRLEATVVSDEIGCIDDSNGES